MNILALLLTAFLGLSCSTLPPIEEASELSIYAPAGERTDLIISHQEYLAGYDEDTKQSEWILYEITPTEAGAFGSVKRSDRFKPDPALPSSSSAGLDDYKRSGYDRGHLAPAFDMSFSKEAMQESFYLSNISPQLPAFNRGIWKRLEEKVRAKAKSGGLVVVTGGILTTGERVGRAGVLAPDYFYKILFEVQNERMTAFLLKASPPISKELKVVTVDEIEAVSGVDFFPQLEDELESRLEGQKGEF